MPTTTTTKKKTTWPRWRQRRQLRRRFSSSVNKNLQTSEHFGAITSSKISLFPPSTFPPSLFRTSSDFFPRGVSERNGSRFFFLRRRKKLNGRHPRDKSSATSFRAHPDWLWEENDNVVSIKMLQWRLLQAWRCQPWSWLWPVAFFKCTKWTCLSSG